MRIKKQIKKQTVCTHSETNSWMTGRKHEQEPDPQLLTGTSQNAIASQSSRIFQVPLPSFPDR